MMFRASRIAAVVVGLVAVAGAVWLHAFAAESTVRVNLSGNRFAPGEVAVHPGDSLAFVNVGGGLHNIAFREDVLTPEQHRLLDGTMPNREEFRANGGEAPLASPILVDRDEVYGFRIPKGLPAGRYEFFCAPHAAAGMKGVLVVTP